LAHKNINNLLVLRGNSFTNSAQTIACRTESVLKVVNSF